MVVAEAKTQVWEEFSEVMENLFNPTFMSSGKEAGPGDPGMGSLVSRTEVSRASDS